MKQIQIVAPEHIHYVWDVVSPMLETAIINFGHNDYNIDHLKVLIIEQYQFFFVVLEDNKIIVQTIIDIPKNKYKIQDGDGKQNTMIDKTK